MLGGKLDGFYSTWGLYLLDISKACVFTHIYHKIGGLLLFVKEVSWEL